MKGDAPENPGERDWATVPREGTFRLGYAPEEGPNGEKWLAVELPRPGASFRAGDVFGFVQTSFRILDLRAPRGMRVVAANERCLANAELARLSPAGEGWLVECEAAD